MDVDHPDLATRVRDQDKPGLRPTPHVPFSLEYNHGPCIILPVDIGTHPSPPRLTPPPPLPPPDGVGPLNVFQDRLRQAFLLRALSSLARTNGIAVGGGFFGGRSPPGLSSAAAGAFMPSGGRGWLFKTCEIMTKEDNIVKSRWNSESSGGRLTVPPPPDLGHGRYHRSRRLHRSDLVSNAPMARHNCR